MANVPDEMPRNANSIAVERCEEKFVIAEEDHVHETFCQLI
jgi:hypothetical protein